MTGRFSIRAWSNSEIIQMKNGRCSGIMYLVHSI